MNDMIFKEMAKVYVTTLGENTKCEQPFVPVNLDTSGLDKKVFEKVQKEKRVTKIRALQKYVKILVPVAASFILILAWIATQNIEKTATEYPASDVVMEMAAVEMIELTASLPANLSVVNQKVDQGTTIYYLEDLYRDDVVMQMNYGELAEQDTEAMKKIEVNGKIIYGQDTRTYKKLVFEENGIVYVLTCRYDINTLLPICEKIL